MKIYIVKKPGNQGRIELIYHEKFDAFCAAHYSDEDYKRQLGQILELDAKDVTEEIVELLKQKGADDEQI